MVNAFLRIACLCALLWGAPAWADGWVTQRAFYEDPSNRMTLHEVQQQTLTPYDGVLARGFSASAFWIRLSVSALPEQSDAIFGRHMLVRIDFVKQKSLYSGAAVFGVFLRLATIQILISWGHINAYLAVST